LAELFPEDLDFVVDQVGDAWDVLGSGRLLLTGGTGFFGCWLLETFLRANDRLGLAAEAIVVTRNPAAFARKAPHLAGHSAVRLHQGDVRSCDFPGGKFTAVIQAATDSATALNVTDPLAMIDTIVAGSRRVYDFAVARGVRQVLLTSSGAVYGRQPPELTHLPEDFSGGPDPLDPLAAYAEGKRLAEYLGAVYLKQYGLAVKIARCFAFLGPHLPLNAHFAAGNFLRDGLHGGPVRVGGDGTPYRSYLYAADLAVWLWTLLFRGQPGRAYNVGSAAPTSIAELARTVADSFETDVVFGRKPAPGVMPERYVPSTRRAREELGLRMTVSLREAVARTVAWHRCLRAEPLVPTAL
jgi:nucleoside-diphosphate-sugar epimerase